MAYLYSCLLDVFEVELKLFNAFVKPSKTSNQKKKQLSYGKRFFSKRLVFPFSLKNTDTVTVFSSFELIMSYIRQK